MDAVVAGHRRLDRQAPMMPRWAYGSGKPATLYETQDALVGIARQYREARIPIDVIVQDWLYWPEEPVGLPLLR